VLDPAFAIDLVIGEARGSTSLRHAMCNSFAFGGTNAVLVASRADAGAD
jgi:3-oxoacyl-[acyl-carrier-protein] synthase II